MKRIYKKIISLVLSFAFIFTLFPLNAFAASDVEIKEATDFIVSKGFIKNEIIHTEKTDEGIKFSMNYLHNERYHM